MNRQAVSPGSSTVTHRAASPRRRSWWATLLVVLALVMLVLLGALVIGGRILVKQAIERHFAQQAPADSWRVSVGPAAGLGLLRMPFDLQAHGTNVRLDEQLSLPELHLDVDGVVADVRRGRIASIAHVGVEALLAEATVAALIKRDATVARLFPDLSVDLQAGQPVRLTGTADLSLLGLPVAGLGSIALSATAQPRIVPPARLGLSIDQIDLSGGGGPLGKLLGEAGELKQFEGVAKAQLSNDLTFDLGGVFNGLRLETVSVVDDAARLTGTIDPATLVEP